MNATREKRWSGAAGLLVLLLLLPGHAAGEDGKYLIGLDLHSSHIGADDPTDQSPAGAVFVDERCSSVSACRPPSSCACS